MSRLNDYRPYILKVTLKHNEKDIFFFKIGIAKDPWQRARDLVKQSPFPMTNQVVYVSRRLYWPQGEALAYEQLLLECANSPASLLYDFPQLEGFSEYVLSIESITRSPLVRELRLVFDHPLSSMNYSVNWCFNDEFPTWGKFSNKKVRKRPLDPPLLIVDNFELGHHERETLSRKVTGLDGYFLMNDLSEFTQGRAKEYFLSARFSSLRREHDQWLNSIHCYKDHGKVTGRIATHLVHSLWFVKEGAKFEVCRMVIDDFLYDNGKS